MRPKQKPKAGKDKAKEKGNESGTSSEEDDDFVDEQELELKKKKMNKGQRSSVSAEVYGNAAKPPPLRLCHHSYSEQFLIFS